MSEYDNATFKWCGKPNPYPKGTDPWKRTEIGRKMGQTGRKTVGEFFAATRPYKTWKTLVGLRLIEIEGYKGRATESEMEAIASNSALSSSSK